MNKLSLEYTKQEKIFSHNIVESITNNNNTRSNLIGLLFPNLSNSFFGELATDIEKILSDKNYKVLICNTENSLEREAKYLKMLLANKADGIIVCSHNESNTVYDQTDMPIVSIDRPLNSNIPTVRSDSYNGACLATEYLIRKKCKKIALFSAMSSNSVKISNLRVQGYIDMMKKHGLEAFFCEIHFDKDNEYQRRTLNYYLERYPDVDGAFVTIDFIAGILNNVLKQRHRKLEIVGYDGTETFLALCGDISTIQQPIREMARVSVDTLLSIINGNSKEANKEYVLPVQLVERIY